MRQRGLLLPVFDNGKSKHRRAVASGGRYNSLAPMMTDDADVAATGRLSNNSNGNHHLLLPNNHHSNNSGAQMTGMASSSSYSTDTLSSLETAPNSLCTNNTIQGHPGDLEFFEDLITEPVLVLGIDISHLSAASQFTVCAVGLFFFSLLYGYLQELLAVELCSRQLGLFLAATQFLGYTVLAYFMRSFVYNRQQLHRKAAFDTTGNNKCLMFDAKHVPFALYLGLSLLRAVDLAMVRRSLRNSDHCWISNFCGCGCALL